MYTNTLTPEMNTARNEVLAAWTQADIQQRFIGAGNLQTNHDQYQRLFGAFYAISHLTGVVSDEDWQKFLKGEE